MNSDASPSTADPASLLEPAGTFAAAAPLAADAALLSPSGERMPVRPLGQIDPRLVAADLAAPRLWGLTVSQLHDRFWRSRGIQIVRPQSQSTVDLEADLYLLAEPNALAIFNPAPVADRLYWNRASLMRLRLHDHRRREYEERVVLDEQGRFVEIKRIYDRLEARLVRVAVTADAKIAQAWVECAGADKPWRQLVRGVPRRLRAAASVPGRCYFDDDASDVALFVRQLTQVWQSPDATIPDIVRRGGRVWAERSQVSVDPQKTRFIGPVWLGRSAQGHQDPSPLVIGPGVIWDEPLPATAAGAESEPRTATLSADAHPVSWSSIAPSGIAARARPGPPLRRRRIGKRLFDIAFACVGLALTLPLYPFILAAIWLEDGGPFFFGHAREKRGGVEFRCWKFRSMCKDAEQKRVQLAAANQADGPQFYIPDDPRVTRVGRVLRRFNLDELPQFWNVLMGDMSIVGPRPSPRKENQFSPAWRDARLSVRPGVTGLWQVCRSRQGGNDFQEWIKYDLEYVQRSSMLLDLVIIWRSIQICIRGERH